MSEKDIDAAPSRIHNIVRFLKDYPFVLLALCFVSIVGFAVFTIFGNPTPFEAAFFQIVILVTGLLGSYLFGRDTAHAGALERVRLHARPAFRRVTALYQSLYDLSYRIEQLRQENDDWRLELIQALVNEHYRTGKDAMEDWRDIAPDYVKEIEGNRTKYDKQDDDIPLWEVEELKMEPTSHDKRD